MKKLIRAIARRLARNRRARQADRAIEVIALYLCSLPTGVEPGKPYDAMADQKPDKYSDEWS